MHGLYPSPAMVALAQADCFTRIPGDRTWPTQHKPASAPVRPRTAVSRTPPAQHHAYLRQEGGQGHPAGDKEAAAQAYKDAVPRIDSAAGKA